MKAQEEGGGGVGNFHGLRQGIWIVFGWCMESAREVYRLRKGWLYA